MSILEIIADKHLGAQTLKKHPHLKPALSRLEKAASTKAEKERIASLVELCFEYDRETDKDEKANILRTLEEISADEPIEVPTEDMEQWETHLRKSDPEYAKAYDESIKQSQTFLKKYFSLRAKAGLKTQADVAKKSSLSRGYVAVIESGEHTPQQKTLQKLAKAFKVDIAELLP